MKRKKDGDASQFRWLFGLSLGVLLAIAAFFLLTEHRAHLFGVLPYLLLLICLVVLVLLWRLASNSVGRRGKSDGGN